MKATTTSYNTAYPPQAYPPNVRQTNSAPRHLKVLLLLLVSLLLLSACVIKVVVPVGGKVVSDNGVICLTGATCTIEVKDREYDDTFRAVPDPGYIFKHWKTGKDHFCAKAKGPCHLLTTILEDNQQVLDVLASSKSYFLKPVFVNKSGYKVAYWKKLTAQIDNGAFSTESYLYDIKPVIAQCDPGDLSPAVNKRTLKVTNKIRALHKLPAVQHDSFYDMQTQETALVQKANNYLSHFPDPADACYTESAASGASTSNIGNGTSGDPASDILGWTNDNFNVAQLDQAGHRRWMLAPELGYLSYGQVEGATALKVFGFPSRRQKRYRQKWSILPSPIRATRGCWSQRGKTPPHGAFPWFLLQAQAVGSIISPTPILPLKRTAKGPLYPCTACTSTLKGLALPIFYPGRWTTGTTTPSIRSVLAIS